MRSAGLELITNPCQRGHGGRRYPSPRGDLLHPLHAQKRQRTGRHTEEFNRLLSCKCWLSCKNATIAFEDGTEDSMQVYILPLSRVRLLPCVATWLLGCAILNANTKGAEPVKIQELSYPWGFPLSGIVFSQDGSLLAAGESGDIAESYDGPHIIIWDVKSGKILHRIRLESLSKCTGQIGSLSFSSDGKNLLFCSSVDNALRVWDVQRGQVVRKIKGHEDDILLGAIYSPDGHFILSLNTKAIIL